MRRDAWMIRDLLRKVEDGAEIPDDPQTQYHVDLLVDGGFLTLATLTLTWKGSELLDLCRNGDRFKSAVNQVAAETKGTNFELLTDFLMSAPHD